MKADVNPRPSASERTRQLLLETARRMIAAGGEPVTVQSLAKEAGVSRATAYRYFTNPDSIVLHASVSSADHPFTDPSWRPPYAEDADLPTRMGDMVAATAEWAFAHTNELRSVLAASLAPDSEARGTSRIGKLNRPRWINAVLEDLPEAIDPATRRHLVNALTPLFGADAVVWTTDAAGLNREQAIEQLRWTAETLVRAVLNSGNQTSP